MIGDIIIGEHKRTTAMRFENIEHFEAYINDIGKDYDGDDTNSSGFIYKLKTPEVIEVNRSKYAKGTILNNIMLKLLVKIVIPTLIYLCKRL